MLVLAFFRFKMIVWNAYMAYGYEVTSQLSFWLVTILTDFFFTVQNLLTVQSFHSVQQLWLKPGWLLAQALTRMHINTISCSTGSNGHTHTHTIPIHTTSSKYSVWHQIRSHSIGSLQLASHGQKQMDFTDAPSTVGGADTHAVLVSQSVQPSCVLFHIRVSDSMYFHPYE